MRATQLFIIVLFLAYLPLHAKAKHLIVTGKLTEVSTSTGLSTWAIQLNPVITLNGRQLSTLEVKTSHPHKLESLEDSFVQAKGTLISSDGADTSSVPTLKLSSVHSVKYNNPDKEKPKVSAWSAVINFFALSPI